jgi:segregation and condensation protein B
VTDGELARVVEAVLFAADAPVTLDRLAEIIPDADRGQIRKAMEELSGHYAREEHSFEISDVAGGWQLYCRPAYSKWVRELHKGRMAARLSQAALETLAIVAYRQPIVRTEIEGVRGVDSSGVLATLLRRDLVTIAGRAPGMGRALMYRTTKEFLRYFGLSSVSDLPRLEEFAEVLGLAPAELELAAQGAESVQGSWEAADDGAGETAPDAPDLADGREPEPAAAAGDVDEGPDEAREECSEVPVAWPGGAGRPDRGRDDSHPLDDREILEEIDEA